jgi:plasmid stabilization system protein ParE
VRIFWTGRYLRALEEIGDYIAERSPRAAARIVNEIHAKTDRLLSANPFIGRSGEIEGTRELVIVGPPTSSPTASRDTQIEVVFVQHGAREWPSEV